MGVRGDMAEPLEDGEGEIGRRNLEGEALADQSGELGLVVERIKARHHTAGAVAEQENRQAGLARLGDLHRRRRRR